MRTADQLHRELEQSLLDFSDTLATIDSMVDSVRAKYRKLCALVQRALTKMVDASGWPIEGWLSADQVFDRLAVPLLKERGNRIAYFMVDALRYELGIALVKLLSVETPGEILAACAKVPTVTPLGMAALLPGHMSDLLSRSRQAPSSPSLTA